MIFEFRLIFLFILSIVFAQAVFPKALVDLGFPGLNKKININSETLFPSLPAGTALPLGKTGWVYVKPTADCCILTKVPDKKSADYKNIYLSQKHLEYIKKQFAPIR